VLDLSVWKILVLAVIALIIFGPERLPGLAAQAGRALRELRRMADGARTELQESLGPEFTQFDLNDLNPKRFVRKHLMDELTGDGLLLGQAADNGNGAVRPAAHPMAPALSPGESPPYDAEAT
jgi:sec-independent protein translocase protein TatB